jgi:hypothetical protein
MYWWQAQRGVDRTWQSHKARQQARVEGSSVVPYHCPFDGGLLLKTRLLVSSRQVQWWQLKDAGGCQLKECGRLLRLVAASDGMLAHALSCGRWHDGVASKRRPMAVCTPGVSSVIGGTGCGCLVCGGSKTVQGAVSSCMRTIAVSGGRPTSRRVGQGCMHCRFVLSVDWVCGVTKRRRGVMPWLYSSRYQQAQVEEVWLRASQLQAHVCQLTALTTAGSACKLLQAPISRCCRSRRTGAGRGCSCWAAASCVLHPVQQ